MCAASFLPYTAAMRMRPVAIRIGAFLAVILASTAVALVAKRQPAVNPDPNHTHADFAVWINGTQWDFSATRYMSEAPAEAAFRFVGVVSAHDGHAEGDVIPERRYIHLHDGNPSVIHMHKPGRTLREFFVSLGWQMENTCLVTDTHERYCNAGGDARWRMFVNEKEEIMNPYYEIRDLDHILLTYGSSREEIFTQMTALTDEACLYSRTCPERGDPPSENCIADPAVPCVE